MVLEEMVVMTVVDEGLGGTWVVRVIGIVVHSSSHTVTVVV